ncbi:hypothetical protein SASPL_153247 [Salvia splendens]|uniref:Uncharacterized protein n=1 Tax=Salvia splendens TaxID=180675 RepID=A0A8X8W4H7_SALSN|nr:hypothetical protein SASPL_153247 [Salvia splendens]
MMLSTLFCLSHHLMASISRRPSLSGLVDGLPTLDGSEHLLRTDLVEDKEGFFVALFVRRENFEDRRRKKQRTTQKRKPLNFFVARLLKLV